CVTGASRGIGAEICLELANHGFIVIGLARGINKIQELSKRIENDKHGKIIARKCNVENENEILESFQWIKQSFGKLDIFVNNAGVMMPDLTLIEKTENIRKMFDVNVIALFTCVREAVKVMKETSVKGHIIVINSILGHKVPDIPRQIKPPFGFYPATKFAVNGFCQTLRQELNYETLPIKLTSVSPGMVDSEMINCMDEELVKSLPKLSTVDVAKAVLFAITTPHRVKIDEIVMNAMDC
ncbi:CLUMA_CG009124, isoform A, partial [Clunio marinus]